LTDITTSILKPVHVQFRVARILCRRGVMVIPEPQKSCAQVGTSVVTPCLPISGERCSGSRKKREGKKRAWPLHVRYGSFEEIELVRTKASEADRSVNSFIRAATLGANYIRPINPELKQELRSVKRQLIGIGTNLNQLVARVNAGTGSIDSTLSYIDTVREPLLEALASLRHVLSRCTGPMP